MKQALSIFFAVLIGFTGCSIEAEVDAETGDLTSLEYDVPMLEKYRSILPNGNLLTVTVPSQSEEEATGAAERKLAPQAIDAVGAPAFVPAQAVPMALAINGVIAELLTNLQWVVDQPPSAWNSETLEFVWGPWDNEDSALEGDTIAVYIRDQGEDADDFRYVYALLRGIESDLSTMSPVIWGGSNPDPENEDFGNGVILWDFEANREWEAQYHPDRAFSESGRFAAAYARGEDEEDEDSTVTWVVAALRDVVTEENDDPLTMDYLYGSVENSNERIDFADFNIVTDIDDDETKTDLEDLGIRMAFYNHGTGRAEIDAIGGDIEEGYYVEGTECWDADIDRTYLTLDAIRESDGETYSIIGPIGAADQCAMPSLEGIPTIEDIDSELLAALDEVATNGLPEE
jgi:hypothetical protein